MRSAYRGLAYLILLGVLVQAAAIAFGWFQVISDLDDGLVLNKDYDGNGGHATHAVVGMTVMPLLGLMLLLTSFFAKFPGAPKWAGLTFAAIVVQVALGIASFSLPGLGALHGVNAFIVFGLALTAARRVPADASADASVTADTRAASV